MSATNRSDVRRPDDFYETPAWCVRRLLEAVDFFRANMPDVYVLPNRPCFTGDGRTDATEYCWAVWMPERGRKAGLVSVLAETPASERR